MRHRRPTRESAFANRALSLFSVLMVAVVSAAWMLTGHVIDERDEASAALKAEKTRSAALAISVAELENDLIGAASEIRLLEAALEAAYAGREGGNGENGKWGKAEIKTLASPLPDEL